MRVYNKLFEDQKKIQPPCTVLLGYNSKSLENLSIAEIHCRTLGQAGYKVIPFYVTTQGRVLILGLKCLRSLKLVMCSSAVKIGDLYVHAVDGNCNVMLGHEKQLIMIVGSGKTRNSTKGPKGLTLHQQ